MGTSHDLAIIGWIKKGQFTGTPTKINPWGEKTMVSG